MRSRSRDCAMHMCHIRQLQQHTFLPHTFQHCSGSCTTVLIHCEACCFTHEMTPLDRENFIVVRMASYYGKQGGPKGINFLGSCTRHCVVLSSKIA